MGFEESIERGVFFGFVPHRLEIEGRPELGFFPFNVMFLQYKMEGEVRVTGTAIYEPDLESFRQESDVWSMGYHNAYGGTGRLVIEYYPEQKRYEGTKFVHGEEVGSAGGTEWNMFFVHFTALGLANGERCMFDDPER